MNAELVTTPATALAAPSAPIAAMLQAVIERGITTENIAGLEKLVELYERQQSRDAERQFAAAFVALQSDIPAIHAMKTVPDKFGNLKYKFAPYEEIMAAVRPVMLRNGFTVTFTMNIADGRVTQSCTLQHVGGHSRVNQFMVRIGNGPPGCSEAQGDGAAATYAKRHALCAALNIVVDHDSDGRTPDAAVDGAPIAPDKAAYLRELVAETKSDEAAFLRFAGAATFAEIGAAKWDLLVSALRKKVRR